MSSSVQNNTNRLIEVNHNNNNNCIYSFYLNFFLCIKYLYCHKFVVSNKIKLYTYEIVYTFLRKKRLLSYVVRKNF